VLPLASCETSDWALASSRTRRLLIGGLVEALLIELDTEGPCRGLGAFFQGLEIGLRGHSHFVQVGIQPHAIPAGGLQVLPGANKGAGPVMDRLAQGAEIAACFRYQEDKRLLGLLGDGHKYAFVPGLASPGLHARKPVGGRRIGRAAQERHYEDVPFRLALGKIRVDPEAIAGKEIGGLADGEGQVAPLHMDIDLGSG
jgi:hypothetical protein